MDKKSFEEKSEKLLFKKLNEADESQQQALAKIEDVGKDIVFEKNLPNIVRTIKNKIIEIKFQFKKVGLSMFARENPKIDCVQGSFIGDAIIEDLITYMLDATNELSNYSAELTKTLKGIEERSLAVKKNINPIQRFFNKIKSFFGYVEEETIMSYSKIEELNEHLTKYREIDTKVFKYNLEENIVKCISKKVINEKYNHIHIPEILEDSVYPDLEILGMGGLIPKLQESIVEEYKNKLRALNIPENNMVLFVPNFNKQNQTDYKQYLVDGEEIKNKQENAGKKMENERTDNVVIQDSEVNKNKEIYDEQSR